MEGNFLEPIKPFLFQAELSSSKMSNNAGHICGLARVTGSLRLLRGCSLGSYLNVHISYICLFKSLWDLVM